MLLLLALATALVPGAPTSASERPLAPANAPPAAPSNQPPIALPRTWIIDVAANEIRAINHPNSYLRYRMRTVDRKGDQVRDTIESSDGFVARLILKDGRPLTPDEDRAERDRLSDMLASPSEYKKHIEHDQSGKKMAIDLIRLMPDAMVVIDYTPNPNWSPPDITSQALTGLRGRMWIDAKSHQMLRMEGTVFQGVNFGYGMLAHIYPGGTVSLDQADAGNGRWIYTRFVERVRIRALMLKTINEDATIEASGFQTLPGPIPYQEAIRRLLGTPLPTV